MSYLGNSALPFNPLATSGRPLDAQRFNGDNSNTTFTLNFRVNNPTDLEVFVENVQQEPLTAYDAYNNQLVFTEAPPTGTNNIYVVYRNSDPGIYAQIPDGSITFNKLANNIRLFTTDNFTGDGGTTTFNLSSDVPDANTLVVAVDGVFQRAPIHYTATGNTITFSSAPPSSSNVHVRHLGFRTTQTVTALPANTTITQPTLETPNVNGDINITGNVTVDSVGTSLAFTRVRGNGPVQNNLNRASNDASAAAILIQKSRGTISSPAAINLNDFVGVHSFNAFDGTQFRPVGQLVFYADTYNGPNDLSGGFYLAQRARGPGGALYQSMSITSDGQQFSVIPGGTTLYPEFKCRAWVNFNGTNGAIRGSGNVSSVTRNSAGDYTLNFANALPDSNYAITAGSNSFTDADPGGGVNIKLQTSSSTSAATLKSTTQVRMIHGTTSRFDYSYMFVSIFR